MIDIQQLRDRLKISFIGKSGNVEFKEIAIPKSERFKWEYSSSDRCDPVFKSWDEKPVKSVPSHYLSKYRIEEFLKSLGDDYTKELNEFNQPNVWYCDIEVEVGDDFPDPEKAMRKVLTIALINSNAEVTVLGLKKLSSKEITNIRNRTQEHLKDFITDPITFTYVEFEHESDLLESFFVNYVRDIPLLTGWNFVRFDWRYLVNRARRLNIDPCLSSVSGQLKGNDEIPEHKIIVDYLELYKKWDRVVKLKENNKLDTVAKAALGISKVHMDSNFMNMYETDFETYVFYNIIDTFLVYLLDRKLKTLQVFLLLGLVTGVEAMSAFSPIRMAETVATKKFYDKHRVVVENKNLKASGQFEGAYVKIPIPGFYENIAIFDFASLYPSTMRQFNISPETFKGMNVEIPEGSKWITTASGAVFDNENDSVVRDILTQYYAMRKEAKGKAFQIAKEKDYLKQLLLEK